MVRDIIFRGIDPYENFLLDQDRVDLQGWGHDHPILQWGVETLHPELIIEVGSWKGMSAINMALKSKSEQLDNEILCVDTWLGSPEHWLGTGEKRLPWWESLKIKNGCPSLYKTFLSNVVSKKCQSIITPFPLTSEAAFVVLDRLSIKAEMIYIDAGHEYESVLRDIRHYWNLLSEDGVMILDDLRWPGVNKAVNEFAKINNLILYGAENTGLLTRNKDLEVPLPIIRMESILTVSLLKFHRTLENYLKKIYHSKIGFPIKFLNRRRLNKS